MTKALRARARQLFDTAVLAADPGAAVRRSLADRPVTGPVRLIALGKAAGAMMEAALAVLPGPVRAALMVTNAENAAPLPGVELFVAGHPVPDAGGLAAGARVLALLEAARADEKVVVLVSGGGSALLPVPVDGLTLADKAAVSRLLLGSGLEIGQMNAVRQHLSKLKGGGLLRAAAPARVVALILSDVVGDDLRVIASGPTVAPAARRAVVRDMLKARGLWETLPPTVREALKRPESEQALPEAENRLIGGNGLSLQAMVAQGAEIWNPALCGDVEQAADWLVARIKAAPPGAHCAVCGGETTVVLRGSGRGGRNQELALRVAAGLSDFSRPWVFLSGGTDGRDGPTDAAGGLVDGGTLARIGAAGGDWRGLLADNDSYRALTFSGDLLVTGGTGTNVADVQIVMLG